MYDFVSGDIHSHPEWYAAHGQQVGHSVMQLQMGECLAGVGRSPG